MPDLSHDRVDQATMFIVFLVYKTLRERIAGAKAFCEQHPDELIRTCSCFLSVLSLQVLFSSTMLSQDQ